MTCLLRNWGNSPLPLEDIFRGRRYTSQDTAFASQLMEVAFSVAVGRRRGCSVSNPSSTTQRRAVTQHTHSSSRYAKLCRDGRIVDIIHDMPFEREPLMHR